jgi:hypothetical protein
MIDELDDALLDMLAVHDVSLLGFHKSTLDITSDRLLDPPFSLKYIAEASSMKPEPWALFALRRTGIPPPVLDLRCCFLDVRVFFES